MKALVHDGNGHITLEDRPEPQLQSPTDAIVRVTRSTICTSDLHIIHGAVPRTYHARGSPRAAAAIANRRHRPRHALDHLHE